MTTLTIEVDAFEVRMMRPAKAAKYLDVPQKQLPKVCPVQPVSFGALGTRYDRKEIDAWLLHLYASHGLFIRIEFDGSFEDAEGKITAGVWKFCEQYIITDSCHKGGVRRYAWYKDCPKITRCEDKQGNRVDVAIKEV